MADYQNVYFSSTVAPLGREGQDCHRNGPVRLAACEVSIDDMTPRPVKRSVALTNTFSAKAAGAKPCLRELEYRASGDYPCSPASRSL